MKVTSKRWAIVPGIAALALTLGACGGESSAAEGEVSGTLSAGGASTQQAAMAAWGVGFQENNPDVTVNYDPVGSGGGRENFVSGAFPFAGTDAYLDNEEGELDMAKKRCNGTDPIEVPSYISPIAVVFNVEGVEELNLTPDAIGGIFAGKITKWDDKAIAETNPDAKLPSAEINAVHRSDESGTTENFTDYLDAAAKSAWTAGVVESWPKEFGGEGAKGTSGVVGAVENGQNSIGYADASQAGDLGIVNVKVGEEFVAPSPEAAAKILEVSPAVKDRPDVDMAVDLDHETAESGTYPITLTSYVIACQEYSDQAEADLTKAFLTYILSEDGQNFAAEEAGSAPLSEKFRNEALKIVEKISAAG